MAKLKVSKMVAPGDLSHDLEDCGSLMIDSILSQNETRDILAMLAATDGIEETSRPPSFCTSTQMGGRNQHRRPYSPPLSPVSQNSGRHEGDMRAEQALQTDETNKSTVSRKHGSTNMESETGMFSLKEMNFSKQFKRADASPNGGTFRAHDNSERVAEGAESVRKAIQGVNSVTTNDGLGDTIKKGVRNQDGEKKEDGVGNNVAVSNRFEPLVAVSDDEEQEAPVNNTDEENDEKVNRGGDNVEVDDMVVGSIAGSDTHSQGLVEEEDDCIFTTKMKVVVDKMDQVNDVLGRLDARTTTLTSTIRNLENSLEFSQNEIVLLKKENAELKEMMGSMELEDRRTQFQVKNMDDKLDRIETATKRRNLLFEGIPEPADKREDVHRTIGNLFDQLNVNRGINFEACYRLGPYTQAGPRPILVCFERQGDREMVYAKRMDLKHTEAYRRVWINEDLGPVSKQKRGIIRMISREAQHQGIDCRTGKYAVHIDGVKFDDNNLQDLPPQLQPTNLKQIQLDDNTIAYQSEYAPFSNFYPREIRIGQLRFFCAEQAFQFLRAKKLGKHLAATRIYLSRDVRYIKQVGHDIGTSKEWEEQQYELMYTILKKKFNQHNDLKTLLLKTDDMELVEATPDRNWGCGATLSSNILRKKDWKGKNKHGKILMTIRDEYRLLEIGGAKSQPWSTTLTSN